MEDTLKKSVPFTARLNPVDWLSYGYFIGLSILTLIFHSRIPGSRWLLLGHAAYLGILTALILVTREDFPRVLVLFRLLAPLLFLFLTYRETELYMRVFRDRWIDPGVTAMELSLFGVHPTLWLQRFVHPWLNELFKFVYGTYFLLIPALPLALFAARRDGELLEYVFTLLVSFYLCYIGFMIFPAMGPRYYWGSGDPGRSYPFPLVPNPEGITLNPPHLRGYIFSWIVDSLMSGGDSTGACIPSAHNAAAIVVLLGIRRHFRRFFPAALPLVIAVCLSTVYNRYHYVTDMVSGVAVGLASVALGRRLFSLFAWRPPAAGPAACGSTRRRREGGGR